MITTSYKEILEQGEVIERTITGRLEEGSPEIPITKEKAQKYEKIWIVACGTAYHACLTAKYYFENNNDEIIFHDVILLYIKKKGR